MKVFLTGATGFIGSHLCKRLVAEGHEVVALVRDPAKAKGLPSKGIEYVRGDLGIFREKDRVLPQCDLVMHLAAVTFAEKPEDYDTYNYQAVVDFVECLKRQSWKPKRFLFASSQAAGGPSDPNRPVTEEDPSRPVDPYGRAKLKAEEYLRTAPFPTTSFRPAMVLGPGDPASLSLFEMAQRGMGFVKAGPPQRVSFIDVDDLVDAIFCMVQDKSAEHKFYYACHSDQTDQKRLWEAVGRAVGKRVIVLPIPQKVLYGAHLVSDRVSKLLGVTNRLDEKQYALISAPAFLASSTKLQKELGWTPRYDLQATVDKAARGYRELGWL